MKKGGIKKAKRKREKEKKTTKKKRSRRQIIKNKWSPGKKKEKSDSSAESHHGNFVGTVHKDRTGEIALRETEKPTDRDRESERMRERILCLLFFW